MLKSVLKRLLGEVLTGRLEYYLKPSLKGSWGGPMNGQAFRRRIYEEIMGGLPIEAIVETGTFRGTTTEYFAASGLPVYTAEASPRFHAYARLRLREAGAHVHLNEGDSRAVLRKLAADASVPKSNVFFYLDAHWEEDLPLREEVEIILDHWQHVVIMVDDFEVPGTSYTYDDYGDGKVLSLDYLAPLRPRGLRAFFPAVPAEEETGARRGCVVLCNEEAVAERLAGLGTLTEHATHAPEAGA